MAQSATIVRRPTDRATMATEANLEEREGGRGGVKGTPNQRILIEWLQDRIDDGQDMANGDGMEEGMTMEEQELAEIGLRIGRRRGAEMVRWIGERIDATLSVAANDVW